MGCLSSLQTVHLIVKKAPFRKLGIWYYPVTSIFLSTFVLRLWLCLCLSCNWLGLAGPFTCNTEFYFWFIILLRHVTSWSCTINDPKSTTPNINPNINAISSMTLVCQNMVLLLVSNYPIAYIETRCSISFGSHFGRTTRGSTPTRQPANAKTLPSWHLPGVWEVRRCPASADSLGPETAREHGWPT